MSTEVYPQETAIALPAFVTWSEFAALLGVSTDSIRKWAASEDNPDFPEAVVFGTNGRTTRYAVDDVVDYAQSYTASTDRTATERRLYAIHLKHKRTR